MRAHYPPDVCCVNLPTLIKLDVFSKQIYGEVYSYIKERSVPVKFQNSAILIDMKGIMRDGNVGGN